MRGEAASRSRAGPTTGALAEGRAAVSGELVETELSPERHYAGLMQVYEQALGQHRAAASSLSKGLEIT